MRHILLTLLLALTATFTASAQSSADKIVGVYRAVQDGNVSKVKISKVAGGYRAQVIWLEKPNNPDGTPRTDKRNPDKAKRATHSDRIVLVEKVVYKDGVWGGGKIYDPTKGKTFKVEMRFKDAHTLAVTGSLLVFSQTVYWTKLQ